MANIFKPKMGLPKTFDKLWGPQNYFSWSRELEPIAQDHGVWNMITGHEAVLPKPVLSGTHTSDATTSPSTQNNQAPTQAVQASTTEQLVSYKIQLNEWEDNDRTARLAVFLLSQSVEPYLWSEIENQVNGNPHDAWNLLKSNQPSADLALSMNAQKLRTLKYTDYHNVFHYISEAKTLYEEITNSGGTYPRARMMHNLIRGLPNKFATFKDMAVFTYDTDDINEDDYKAFIKKLVRFAKYKEA